MTYRTVVSMWFVFPLTSCSSVEGPAFGSDCLVIRIWCIMFGGFFPLLCKARCHFLHCFWSEPSSVTCVIDAIFVHQICMSLCMCWCVCTCDSLVCMYVCKLTHNYITLWFVLFAVALLSVSAGSVLLNICNTDHLSNVLLVSELGQLQQLINLSSCFLAAAGMYTIVMHVL